MVEYKGSKCIVCGEVLKDGDDIVVCPDCGTPYHRACYNKEGKCINIKLHESGKSWQPDSTPERPARICIRCHAESPADALYCCRCGMPFNNAQSYGNINRQPNDANNMNGFGQQNQNEQGPFMGGIKSSPVNDGQNASNSGASFTNPYGVNYSDPLCGFNPSEKYSDDVNVAELGAFVDSNTFYYLPKFKFMKEMHTKFSMNFIAMFFPELYFANRKMIPMAILALFIKIITIIPGTISNLSVFPMSGGILKDIIGMFDVSGDAFQKLLMLAYVLNLAFSIGMGMFANSIYLKHCLNKIPKIKSSTPPNFTLSELHTKGGTSVWLLVTFIVIEMIAVSAFYMLAYASL